MAPRPANKQRAETPRSPYMPNEREQAVHDRQEARLKGSVPLPSFEHVSTDGSVVKLRIDHEDPLAAARLMLELFGNVGRPGARRPHRSVERNRAPLYP